MALEGSMSRGVEMGAEVGALESFLMLVSAFQHSKTLVSLTCCPLAMTDSSLHILAQPNKLNSQGIGKYILIIKINVRHR